MTRIAHTWLNRPVQPTIHSDESLTPSDSKFINFNKNGWQKSFSHSQRLPALFRLGQNSQKAETADFDDFTAWVFSHDLDQTIPFDKFDPTHLEADIQIISEILLKKIEDFTKSLKRNRHLDWNHVVVPYLDIRRCLYRAWSVCGNLASVLSAWAEPYTNINANLNKVDLALHQNPALISALEKLKASNLTPVQLRLITNLISEAQNAGVQLQEQEKDRFAVVTSEIKALESQFKNNVTAAQNALQLDFTDPKQTLGLEKILEKAYKQAHPESQNPTAEQVRVGPWRLKFEDLGKCLEYAQNRDLRREAYSLLQTVAVGGDFDNSQILTQLFQLREEEARLLGYSSAAAKVLAGNSVRHLQTWHQLYDAAWQDACQKNRLNTKQIFEFAKSQGFEGSQLEMWDYKYWARLKKENDLQIVPSAFEAQLNLANVEKQLFAFWGEFFGIAIRPESGVPTWDNSVRCFGVYDIHGEKLARIYLDPYRRDGKDHNFTGSFIEHEVLPQGQNVAPAVVMSLNLPQPEEGQELVLSLQQYVDMAHEWGHALQIALDQSPYIATAGMYGMESDAKESASELFQFLAESRIMLQRLGFDEQQIQDILKLRQYDHDSYWAKILMYGMVDMALYSSETTIAHIEQARQIYIDFHNQSGLPTYPENSDFNPLNSNTYLIGYAGNQYAYTFSKNLALAYLSKIENRLNQGESLGAIGTDLRNTLFSMGGTQAPLQVFEAFTGQPLSFVPSDN